MATKRTTVEDLAHAETQADLEREERRRDAALRDEKLSKEVPARFLELVRATRGVVERFNAASEPPRRIQWRESAAIAVGDVGPNRELTAGLWRKGAEIDLALVELSRPRGPDAHIMLIHGRLGRSRFEVRVDGSWSKGKVGWRVSIDGKPAQTTIDELPELLVTALVKEELTAA